MEEYEGEAYVELGELLEEWEAESKKKNFRNFVGKFFGGSIAGYHPYHILTHPWILIGEARSQIKWAWQRVFRGWDDRVTWSIDSYLSQHIPDWMEKLKKDKFGVPSMMFQDGDYVGDNWEIPDEVFEKRAREYDRILDQIALGFRFYYKLNNEVVDEKSIKIMKRYFDNVSFPLFVKYFGTFWD